jgi:hypothetical protein
MIKPKPLENLNKKPKARNFAKTFLSNFKSSWIMCVSLISKATPIMGICGIFFSSSGKNSKLNLIAMNGTGTKFRPNLKLTRLTALVNRRKGTLPVPICSLTNS